MTETDLCRLCAQSKVKVIGIYDSEGQKLAIEEKIARFLHLQVISSDSLPLSVCTDCCTQLDQCNTFYMRAHQAQISLRELCDRKESNSQDNLDIESAKIEEENKQQEQSGDAPADNPINVIYMDELDAEDRDENTELHSHLHGTCNESTTIKQSQPKKEEQSKKQELRVIRKTPQISTEAPRGVSSSEDDDAKTLENEGIERGTGDSENYDSEAGVNTEQKSLDTNSWLCTNCDDKLTSVESLEEHHKTIHNQQPKYMCVQCWKVYDKYNGFLTHIKRHNRKTKFTCTDCGKSFSQQKVLESHRAIHSEDRPYVCPTCNKSFRQQSALYIHSRCHLPETMKNRYPCEQCGKAFSTKPNLVTHMRIHAGIRNFTCDQCGKSFIQKGNLEAHFLTHSSDKPFKCSQCTKAFKTALQLKKHETVHTGDKPHECTICGRTFREKGTLREHHRIHTGAMPFTCEFCGKSFRFKGILTTHRRQHTGERPYSCLECQHHFTNWPNYNKHMKRKHGIDTSHTKHLNRSPTQAPTQKIEEDRGAILTPETTSSLQVVETLPQTSSQIIDAEPITSKSPQVFPTEYPVATIQNTSFVREKGTTYLNGVPVTIQNYVSYNLYTLADGADDTILPN